MSYKTIVSGKVSFVFIFRLITFVCMVLALLGKPEVLFYGKPWGISDETNRAITFTVFFIVFTLSVALPLMFRFLNSNASKTDTARSRSLLNRLAKKVYELETSNQDINKKVAQYIDSNLKVRDVEDKVYERAIGNIEEHLIEKLNNDYAKLISADIRLNKVTSYLQPLEKGIETYIEKLQKNSIVNLLIGITGTTLAVTVLLIILLSNREFTNFSNFSVFFLPRLTFVVSIQLFAFFFLRLYKNNLEDVKYFQNELTNIVSKTTSFKLAALYENKAKFDELLDKLSSVERNFILHKDDTLLNIEKAKIEKDLDIEILKSFKETFNNYKKENGKPST